MQPSFLSLAACGESLNPARYIVKLYEVFQTGERVHLVFASGSESEGFLYLYIFVMALRIM